VGKTTHLKPGDRLLTQAEAGKHLGCCLRTVQRMVRERKLRVVKLPPRSGTRPLIRILKSELARYERKGIK
jgi:excisionase family DNA binding protein